MARIVTGAGHFNDSDLKLVLPQHPEVEELDLSGSDVTSDGMAELSTLSQLVDLDISNTLVDDSALPHLKLLTGLCFLNLSGTHVTRAGEIELSQALPNCIVYRS